MTEALQDVRVAVATVGEPNYHGDIDRRVWGGLEFAAKQLGWWEYERGPLAEVVPAGSRVWIKPNLVHHADGTAKGVSAVVTNRALIDAAFRAAHRAGAAEIIVGDAPLQGCDFPALLKATTLDQWSRQAHEMMPSFTGIRDYRRTITSTASNFADAASYQIPAGEFTLFDLAANSLLEPITTSATEFRVTCYDPKLLKQRHAKGKHQYLVASDLLRADVVINLPKLKMHKRAGVTCALKNFVGINGQKEFLPHHRQGSPTTGGDCYPTHSVAKTLLERILDVANSGSRVAEACRFIGRRITSFLSRAGDTYGVEGSWPGNDTIWRMCLDLNRIVCYGRADGTIANNAQRKTIHLVDAVIAGQGEGPLQPEPFPMGFVLLGRNAAAIDLVGALMLDFEPDLIPLVHNAFRLASWPIASFSADDVLVVGDLGRGHAVDLVPAKMPVEPYAYPRGWEQVARQHLLANAFVPVETSTLQPR